MRGGALVVEGTWSQPLFPAVLLVGRSASLYLPPDQVRWACPPPVLPPSQPPVSPHADDVAELPP